MRRARRANRLTMIHECENLDAYLAKELPAGAAAHFARHLDECEPCRHALDQQRWIDRLLASSEIESLEPAPPELRDALRTSIGHRRRAAQLFACSLAAAAAVAIVAAGWTLMLNRQAMHVAGPTTGHIAKTDVSESLESSHSTAPHATFVSNGDTIAVPLESTDDEVTIVQLYPTTETERRTRRELALQLIYSESNGG
jgi:anti-sigma factor RsiW